MAEVGGVSTKALSVFSELTQVVARLDAVCMVAAERGRIDVLMESRERLVRSVQQLEMAARGVAMAVAVELLGETREMFDKETT